MNTDGLINLLFKLNIGNLILFPGNPKLGFGKECSKHKF
jgi:hypothetical protein